jgi:mRNA interferase MazF
VTVAGISSTVRAVATELRVGKENGLDRDYVVNLDDVQTIRRADLGRFVGYLNAHQELALHRALIRAFDLDD